MQGHAVSTAARIQPPLPLAQWPLRLVRMRVPVPRGVPCFCPQRLASDPDRGHRGAAAAAADPGPAATRSVHEYCSTSGSVLNGEVPAPAFVRGVAVRGVAVRCGGRVRRRMVAWECFVACGAPRGRVLARVPVRPASPPRQTADAPRPPTAAAMLLTRPASPACRRTVLSASACGGCGGGCGAVVVRRDAVRWRGVGGVAVRPDAVMWRGGRCGAA